MGLRLRGNVHGDGVQAGHRGVARGPIGRPAPHGQRGETQEGGLSRTFLTTSWERVGHFDQNGRDVGAVLLAIGMSQGGSDIHYGKKCARAG